MSPNVVRIMRLRMRWKGYVAHMRGTKYIQNCRWKNVKGGIIWESICRKVILKWIFKKWELDMDQVHQFQDGLQ
jgi:hypothetical protein